jgi:hypothetical protein
VCEADCLILLIHLILKTTVAMDISNAILPYQYQPSRANNLISLVVEALQYLGAQLSIVGLELVFVWEVSSNAHTCRKSVLQGNR